ncbi:MAG: PEP-CTERM sorting domain-containing protein [Acidobacteriia bacterium]|nr:PEP-CTERM sorting domain-containing protein [Terriglobia bacterium]
MKRWLLLGALIGFSSAEAMAAPLCLSGSYQSYMNLNASGGCQFGNAIFSNFSFAYQSNDGTTSASPNKGAASVTVTPENQPVADDNHPGLAFGTANLTPAIGSFEDYTFTFTVSALTGFFLDDAFLKMTGAFLVGDGVATTIETLTPFNNPQTNLNGFFTFAITNQKTSSVVFNNSSSLTVTKDVKLSNSSALVFDLSSVSNDFSLVSDPVPEPVTSVMIGLGLCGLGFSIRKRLKKS